MPGYNLPAFLIDDELLLDAGTIGLSLSYNRQLRIKDILVTHSHLDHIKGIPFLLDNIITKNKTHSVRIISGTDVINDLKKDVFNDRIWPDFTKIPDRKNPALKFRSIRPSRSMAINGYRVYCERVNHLVPAYGYIIKGPDKKTLVYTGDTGPTSLLWQKMAHFNVRCLIIEVSFPNSMTELAIKTGHLTAALLKEEIEKFANMPARIYITHTKPQYMKQIRKEINALGIKNIEILRDNRLITV